MKKRAILNETTTNLGIPLQNEIDSLQRINQELLRKLCSQELYISSQKDHIELIKEDNRFLQTQNKEYKDEILKLRDWIDKNINDAHQEVIL